MAKIKRRRHGHAAPPAGKQRGAESVSLIIVVVLCLIGVSGLIWLMSRGG